MDKPKRTPGRPPTPPEEALVLRSLRLKPRQWAEIDAQGVEWLRGLLDRHATKRRKGTITPKGDSQ